MRGHCRRDGHAAGARHDPVLALFARHDPHDADLIQVPRHRKPRAPLEAPNGAAGLIVEDPIDRAGLKALGRKLRLDQPALSCFR